MTEQIGFRRLRVWQESHTLVLLVYQATKNFPKNELFGLTSQIQRASVSIAANIAEGHARNSRKEFLQFLSISKGSLVEVEYYVQLSRDLSYISSKEQAHLESQIHFVGVLLHKFTQAMTH